MSEARLSEWSEWDLESWVWTVPKDHSKLVLKSSDQYLKFYDSG